ncbi:MULTISPECIES: response regulator [unclassified Paenibacillus]|uniref:response regulator n=1 Tax=unclassified Paenibacillus TaxID=185978 RepID=UPI001042A928|nr:MULTISPECIES: response regulator [unclassified Paenibacillus]NIK70393.1 two-component system response regulator YesN [Paenibacillus sp. BK720]TCM90682.1 two-component system response regulator YesN [Paenibacillus sp. BK033]
MRQLLIVDDEPIAVEGLKSGVDWPSIGISRVMTAYNADQAMEIFNRERVDILLCDIEMPKASGLQLLEWVRGNCPGTETIFLTCHADFQYAKQAIQLGSLDYLLKPIPYDELKVVVEKAIRKMEKEQRMSEFSQFGKFWLQHQPMLIERFWLDVLSQAIPALPQAISTAAQERNIPYSDKLVFLPILLRVRRWYKEYSLRDKKTMEYALRKAAEEVLMQRQDSGLLIATGDDTMLIVLNGGKEGSDPAGLKALCESYIAACRVYFKCDVSCYIGESVRGHEMAAAYQRLQRMDADNVASDNCVSFLGERQGSASSHTLPDMGMWGIMMKEGAKDKVIAEAERFIGQQVEAGRLTPQLLALFVQDFQQMVHYVLQIKGIQAHQLLSDGMSAERFARAGRSAKDALIWVRHLVGKSIDYMHSLEQTPSVVEQAKAYIQQHLADEISREDIASHVYLNPDYLTRIFKRETGMSISDYLLQQRLHIAAELLTNTDLAVSAVASRIGYANFSHFSRIFKKYMGINPQEYRQSRSQPQAQESRQSDSVKS